MAFIAEAHFYNSNSNGGNTNTVDFAGATLLVCAHLWFDGAAGTGTFLGDNLNAANTFTALTESVVSNVHLTLYYKLNPVVSSPLTGSCGGNSSYPQLFMAGFSGYTTFDREAGGTVASATTNNQSITPAADGELILSAFFARTNPDNLSSAPSGYTAPIQHNGDGSWAGSSGLAYLLSSSGASSPTWTLASASASAHRLAAFGVPLTGGKSATRYYNSLMRNA